MVVNRPIMRKLLMLTLLLTMSGCMMPLRACEAQPVGGQNDYILGQTREDVPTWQDLGLRDLLANASENTVEVPQSAAHHTAPIAHRSHDGQNILLAAHRLARTVCALPTRAVDYYIYFLYRLRL